MSLVNYNTCVMLGRATVYIRYIKTKLKFMLPVYENKSTVSSVSAQEIHTAGCSGNRAIVVTCTCTFQIKLIQWQLF